MNTPPPMLAIQFRSFFLSSLAKMSNRDKTKLTKGGRILLLVANRGLPMGMRGHG